MNQVKDCEKSALEFVAAHYKVDHIDVDAAWHRFKIQTGRYNRRNYRHVVAAALGIVVIVAIASSLYLSNRTPQSTGSVDVPCGIDSVETHCNESIKVYKYDNCPINKVLYDVSNYYGVHLVANDSTKYMSGEIEMSSSVDDIIDIIEQTMAITIEKK